MTPQQVAGLTVVLGDHNIQQVGESATHESKAARVVRHKGFSQETLVSWSILNRCLSHMTSADVVA